MANKIIDFLIQADGDADMFRRLHNAEFDNDQIDQGRAQAFVNNWRNKRSNSSTDYGYDDYGEGQNRSRDGRGLSRAPDGIVGWVKEGLSAGQENLSGMRPGEYLNMQDIFNVLVNEQGKARGPLDIAETVMDTAMMGVIDYYRMQNYLLEEMNQKTGMLGTLSKEYREEITNAYPDVIRLGIGWDELTESMTTLIADSGKFKLLSEDTIEEMALASKFAEDMTQYAQMGVEFEKVSMGIYDMTQATNEAGLDSMQIGLNSRQTVRDIAANLELLNRYGFENGVEGLKEMVQQSMEFRMNVTAATNFADRVWSPEGALDVVANLQVLGGAVGALNDPLKLMYMATNNVEGLQDALIDASKALVTYNNEQGRFEVTGANLRRAKEMADEFGMSMGELTQMAVASMERTQAASELMSQGLNLDEDEREFLINMSQMRDGRMTIEIPKNLAAELGTETSVALNDMSEDLAQTLLDRREELTGMEMQDVARQQVSLIANIGRQLSYIATLMRVEAGATGGEVAELLGYDPQKIGEELEGLIDSRIAPVIEGRGRQMLNESDLGKKIQEVTGNSPQPTTTTTATETATETETATKPTQNMNVTVTYRAGDNVVDGVTRSVFNDPWFQSKAKNSFLEMFKPQ